MKRSSRRRVVAALLGAPAVAWRVAPAAADPAGWIALRAGAIALIRHAYAPGVGDPAAMRLGDCATQRNLDETGRAQARRIGMAFAAEGVAVGAVLSSRWCRTLETAELAFPARVRAHAAFDSFFSDPARREPRTLEAQRVLAEWRGPGALVVVTHQVNVTALTGLVPRSGEIVVVNAPSATGVTVVARLEV
jgi:phosphohistidine phosphatase SixA